MGDCGMILKNIFSAWDYLFTLVSPLCLLFFSGVLLGNLLSPRDTSKKSKEAGF